MLILDSTDSDRLTNAKIIWLATISKNLIPHLVPIWYVLIESKLYLCTSDNSVKAKNIIKNSNIAFSLEDGMKPLIGNGTASMRFPEEEKDKLIIKKFKEKYDWNILKDEEYNILIEIEITNILLRKK